MGKSSFKSVAEEAFFSKDKPAEVKAEQKQETGIPKLTKKFRYRPKRELKTARTQILLQPSLMADAKACAESLGISFNELACIALREYVDSAEIKD